MSDIRGVNPLHIGNRNNIGDDDGQNGQDGVGANLDLEQAQKLVNEAEDICNKWASQQVTDIVSDPALTNQFVSDVKDLKDLFGKLAVVADDPTAAAKLNDSLAEHRATITALLKEVSDPQSAAALAANMSTEESHSAIANTQNAGVASGNMASTGNFNLLNLNSSSIINSSRSVDIQASGFPHLNPSGNPFVWDPTDVFSDLPDYINSDNIMAVTLAVFMKLGLAMQGVLALQAKDLSDLGDKIAYLNKVQAAYTEISDYYANGNPAPGQPDGLADPLDADSVNKFFPNLSALLKQNGWDGTTMTGTIVAGTPPTISPAESIAAAFSRMNAQGNLAGANIDTSVLFTQSGTTGAYGTPDYFITSGTSIQMQFGSSANANSAIKAISNITSQGSSLSQKKTATIQSSQTNYNNVWAFCSSFIKDLGQSLQAIAQA